MRAQQNLPDNGSFTHDDYTKLITYVSFPDWLIAKADGDESDRALFAEVKDIRSRAYIGLHQHLFGCVPLKCPTCQDPEHSKRVLNCDDEGNPNDA